MYQGSIHNRIRYIFLVIFTMGMGLLSRTNFMVMPHFLTAFAGDTLWALMVYWGFRALNPARTVLISAFFALSFAYAIEFSQLYQATWINSIREMKIGGLVLGYGFKFSDLLCYLVGVAFGATSDKWILVQPQKKLPGE